MGVQGHRGGMVFWNGNGWSRVGEIGGESERLHVLTCLNPLLLIVSLAFEVRAGDSRK